MKSKNNMINIAHDIIGKIIKIKTKTKTNKIK